MPVLRLDKHRRPRDHRPVRRPRATLHLLAPVLVLLLAGCTVTQTPPSPPSTAVDTAAAAERASEAAVEAEETAASWQAAWDSRSTDVLREWFVANTGPRVDLTESSSGLYRVASQADADGLAGRTVTGRVEVVASGVRVRDFKVVSDGSGSEAVSVAGGLTGVVLEDFEVDGQDQLTTTAAVGGDSYAEVTVRRAHVHHSLDGVRLFEGSTYEFVFVEEATVNEDYVEGTSSQHADAVQVVRAGSPVHVSRSWLDHGADGPNVTSVALVKSDAGAVEDVTVESSYLNGGRYTVIVEEGEHGPPQDVVVRGNRFGRDYQFGLWSGAGVDSGAGYDLSDNVWADTGDPVPTTWGRLR